MEAKQTSQPFVHWAQSKDQIFLRVDVEAKSDPDVTTTKDRLEFSCDGTAPTTGRRNYAFAIDFCSDIVPGSNGYRMDILGSKIQFYIEKADEGFWPHLMKNRAKPGWLKIDFDRFQSGDPDSEEEKEKSEDGRDPFMRNSVDELLKDLKNKRPKGFTQPGLDFKKMYLSAYNMFMLLINFGIVMSLVRNFVADGTDVYERAYHLVGLNVRIMVLGQLLEVVHAALGLVKSNPLPAALQVLARLCVLHVIVYEPYLQTNPAVFWLFMAWSAIELIRYPYYICQLHGVEPPYALKFLRYTSWIPLYPMGMLLETVIYIKALEIYPVSHPEPLLTIGDFKLTVSHLIGAYLCIFPFGCLFNLRHMFKQTKSQLFSKSAVKSSDKRK